MVKIYDGDMDFVVNWIGDKAWTLALDWPGKDSFNNLTDVPYKGADGNIAWYSRTFQGFTFMRVHDAGHMVPLDQPLNGYQQELWDPRRKEWAPVDLAAQAQAERGGTTLDAAWKV